MRALRALATVTAAVVAASGCSLPAVDLEETRPLALRSTITAADGTILARLFRQNRALVPIESMPDLRRPLGSPEAKGILLTFTHRLGGGDPRSSPRERCDHARIAADERCA